MRHDEAHQQELELRQQIEEMRKEWEEIDKLIAKREAAYLEYVRRDYSAPRLKR